MSTENVKRIRAKELVSLFPGVHLRQLQRLLNTYFQHHQVPRLQSQRDGEVVCSRVGGYSRLFPAGFDG